MIFSEYDLKFDFTDAVDGIKFDDSNHGLSHCMKAVDFIVELGDAYLFVEVKDPQSPLARKESVAAFVNDFKSGILCDDLVKKFRDSFLYRWGEDKLNKPIHFLSVITLEDALLNNLQTNVKQQLPFNKVSRWTRGLTKSCHTLNVTAWNRNFKKWPVTRISSQTP